MSFSLFSDSTAAVYTLQTIVLIILLCSIIFTKEWYYILLLSVAFTGGLFNFVDRCIPKEVAAVGCGVPYNVVLDYFSFTHMNTSSWNLPDVSVLTGIIGFGVLYIVLTIVAYILNKEGKNKKQDKKPKKEKK